MNKNQKAIRKSLAKGKRDVVIDVPRRDYDKGCSDGRPSPSAFVNRPLSYGFQTRLSKRAKVAAKRRPITTE